MNTHWIAMGGFHGCLPDFCTACSTKEAAIETLVDLLAYEEDSPTEEEVRDALNEFEIATFERYPVTADYAEIRECNCDNPSVHCDDGQFEE